MKLEWIERSDHHWILITETNDGGDFALASLDSTPVGWICKVQGQYNRVIRTLPPMDNLEEAMAVATIDVRMDPPHIPDMTHRLQQFKFARWGKSVIL
jgi:hypothetical protein